MANRKECKDCGKLKDTTQFSKCSSTKSKLQPKCKECNKRDNHKFRTEINPEHHKIWQDANWDIFMEYMKKYRKADKSGIIYAIINPEGFSYIGMTEMYLKIRILEHRKHYRQHKEGKRHALPLLHESIDKFGWDNHKIETLLQLEGIDRKQLEYIERSFIESMKQQNKSLNTKNW
jgi:hypothetical protein